MFYLPPRFYSLSLISLLPSQFIFSQTQKPNVILIYADDLGFGDLSCYGAKNIQTTNIDHLAQQGIRFTNAYAPAATSTPSRYGILTGEYAWRKPRTDVAAGNAGMIISPNTFTIADLFKTAGYTTTAIGKWHLGLGKETGKQNWNKPLTPALHNLGFDYYYIMAATADRVPCIFIENDTIANYDKAEPVFVSYNHNFNDEPTGKANPELLYNLKPSHGHDMSIVNGISRIGFMKGGGKALWKDENIADSITHKATNFIKQHQKEPFFMYFATNDIHVPRFPHPRFRGKNKMGLRGEAILQFDYSVGEILKTLDSLQLRENTLIILSSDNGPVVDDGYQDQAEKLLNGHSPTNYLRGGKYSAFEGGTRVPTIVYYPKLIKKGTTSKSLISQIDLIASLASFLQVSLPPNVAPDSQNHWHTWIGKNKKNRPWILQQAANKTLSLRVNQWKYIPATTGGPIIPWGPKIETGYLPTPQLYNLKKDPSEKENVIKKHPQIAVKFQKLLQSIKSHL